jgi:HAD superfamily hydrolase (TIGR01509 family)
MPPNLLLFDCDGVLVDSEILGNKILVEAVAEHGLYLTLEEALRTFRGGKMAECVALLEKRLGRTLPEDFVPEIRRRTDDAFRSALEAVPGALDLVRTLTGAKCVVSNGPRTKIELSLSVTGLFPYFQNHIFSAYEVGVWKPDPGLFLHAAQAMGVAPEHCAVVEDSMSGIRAGLAAGMKVFALQQHESEVDLPEEVVVIRSLAELPSLLA